MNSEKNDRREWKKGRLFGVPISTNFPFIINLPGCHRAPQLRISVEDPKPRLTVTGEPIYDSADAGETATPRVQAFRKPGSFELWISGVGCYRIGRSRILCFPATEDWATLEVYLLGTAFSFWLELSGRICLHASSLILKDRTILLLGGNGSGKTTLAVECLRNGCPLVSDDISSLSCENQIWFVHPSYPQLRLWPEAVERLGLDPLELRPVWPRTDKRRVPVGCDGVGHLHPEKTPLTAAFVLQRLPSDQQLNLHQIRSGEAVFTLTENSFLRRLPRSVGLEASRFERLSDLVSQVPIFQFAYPEGIDQLGAAYLKLGRQVMGLGGPD